MDRLNFINTYKLILNNKEINTIEDVETIETTPDNTTILTKKAVNNAISTAISGGSSEFKGTFIGEYKSATENPKVIINDTGIKLNNKTATNIETVSQSTTDNNIITSKGFTEETYAKLSNSSQTITSGTIISTTIKSASVSENVNINNTDGITTNKIKIGGSSAQEISTVISDSGTGSGSNTELYTGKKINSLLDTKLNNSDAVGQKYPNSTGGEIFNDYTNNQASGNYSHAGGSNTKADQANQTAIGKFNTTSNTNSLLSVGNGTADNARSDALVVKSTGEVIINSTATDTTPKLTIGSSRSITGTTTASTDTQHTGDDILASKYYIDSKVYDVDNMYVFNTAMSIGNFQNNKLYLSITTTSSISILGLPARVYTANKVYKCSRTGDTVNSLDEITLDNNIIINNKDNKQKYFYDGTKLLCITIGREYINNNYSLRGEIFNDYTNNIASGNNSHAEGESTKAQGNYSHAEGYNTTASGNNSHAEGLNTTAGSCSHAEGSDTTASGSFSHAGGVHTIASASYSHTEGYYTKADQQSQTAIGKYNTASNTNSLLSVGNGTADDARSDAFVVKSTGEVIINSSATGTTPKLTIGKQTGNNGELLLNGILYANNGITGYENINNTSTLNNIKMLYKINRDNTDPNNPIINDYVEFQDNNSTPNTLLRIYQEGKTYSPIFTTQNADYAELFEVYDESIPIKNYEYKFITLIDDKVKIASNEDDYILGVYSLKPGIIGNYNLNEINTKKNIQVGLLGRLIVIDNNTCSVNSYCQVDKDGCAVPYNKSNGDVPHYRVMKRIDNNKILIMFK